MLFRAQALSHSQQDQTEGRVLVRSPRILWACSIAAILAAAGIALLLFLASYTPQVQASGRVLADGHAELLVPGAALPYLQRGQRLALRFPAADGAGTVLSASGRQVLIAPAEHSFPPAGTSVQARIALREVRLIDWLTQAGRPRREPR